MNKYIKDFMNSCKFGKQIFTDYYGKGNESGYKQDKAVHDCAVAQCKNFLSRLGKISVEEFTRASKSAWSGRIDFNGGSIEYTPGQFGNLEMPQAMSAVLSAIEKEREHSVCPCGCHDIIARPKGCVSCKSKHK